MLEKFAGASTRLYRPRHRAMLPVMKARITAGGGQHGEDCGWIEQDSNDQDERSTYVLVRGEITWSTLWSSFPCRSRATADARQEAAGGIGQGPWQEGLLQSVGKPMRPRLAGVPSPSRCGGDCLDFVPCPFLASGMARNDALPRPWPSAIRAATASMGSS
jgi:hypothetical protein